MLICSVFSFSNFHLEEDTDVMEPTIEKMDAIVGSATVGVGMLDGTGQCEID